jgi:hypothetical protein
VNLSTYVRLSNSKPHSPFARGACDTKAQLIGFDDAA